MSCRKTIMEVNHKKTENRIFFILDTVGKGTYGEPNSPKCIKESVEIN